MMWGQVPYSDFRPHQDLLCRVNTTPSLGQRHFYWSIVMIVKEPGRSDYCMLRDVYTTPMKGQQTSWRKGRQKNVEEDGGDRCSEIVFRRWQGIAHTNSLPLWYPTWDKSCGHFIMCREGLMRPHPLRETTGSYWLLGKRIISFSDVATGKLPKLHQISS